MRLAAGGLLAVGALLLVAVVAAFDQAQAQVVAGISALRFTTVADAMVIYATVPFLLSIGVTQLRIIVARQAELNARLVSDQERLRSYARQLAAAEEAAALALPPRPPLRVFLLLLPVMLLLSSLPVMSISRKVLGSL